MNVQEMIAKTQDALTVKKVFGEPYEKNGITVIPAARVRGGAGGGEDNSGSGGGGFGLNASPAGAFIIKGERVHWEPAVDVNKFFMVGAIALLAFRSVAKTGLKRRGRKRARR